MNLIHCITGLVVEYIVAIDGARFRLPTDVFALMQSCGLALCVGFGPGLGLRMCLGRCVCIGPGLCMVDMGVGMGLCLGICLCLGLGRPGLCFWEKS